MQSAEIFANAKKIVYLNKPLYFYRSGSGMTSKYSPDFYRNWQVVFRHIAGYLTHAGFQDFDRHMAHLYFQVVGEAIRKCRANKDMTYSQRREFLEEIVQDTLFSRFLPYWKSVRSSMRPGRKIMCLLLMSRQYWLIDLAHRLKNHI